MSVSVIIPAHNAENTLRKGVASLLRQGADDLEVIIVDDGSTDRTAEVARHLSGEFASVFTKFSLIRTPNRGACAARNTGVELSKGQYIQFLDADDYLMPGKIGAQLEHMQRSGKNDTVLPYGPWILEDANGSETQTQTRQNQPLLATEKAELMSAFLSGWWCPPHVFLWPRKLLEATGPWNEDLAADQDGEIFFRALCAGSTLSWCDEGGAAVYSQHSSSQISRQVTLQSCASRFEALKIMEQEVRRLNLFSELSNALAVRGYRTFELTVASHTELAKQIRAYCKTHYNAWPSSGSWQKRLFERVFGPQLTYALIEKRNRRTPRARGIL